MRYLIAVLLSGILGGLLGSVASAHSIDFSTTDILNPIHNNLRLDSIVRPKMPSANIISDNLQMLIQSDSVNWYGTAGKFILLLNEEKHLEQLQWNSYRSDSGAYALALNDLKTRFGNGEMSDENVLTFTDQALRISIDVDPQGRFRLFFVKRWKANN